MTTIIRIARTSAARMFVLVALALAASATSAIAETLLMPKRDVLAGSPVVIWGITTQANGTPLSIDFDDGAPPVPGSVGDRSFINFTYTYATPGIKTVTLTVGAETATVEIQVFAPTGPTAAETTRNVRINMAIADGLRFLWTSQSNRTFFDTNIFTNWGRPSFTALAVLAFENHGYRLPSNPAVAPTGIFEKYAVRRGLNTILNQLVPLNIGMQPAGNPCAGAAPAAEFAATGSCVGYYNGSEGLGLAGYANAVMILPLAGSGSLNRVSTEAGGASGGKTYGEILQRLLNAMAWGQADPNASPITPTTGPAGRGGWNYGFNEGNLDGSTAGWNVLAILDAQAAAIPLPTFLVPEFEIGLERAMNTDGSFDYTGNANPASSSLPNVARAGIGAQGHFLMGGVHTDARGTAIKNFINARWNGAFLGGDYTGTCGGFGQNKNCAYAMFNVFKGLKLLGVQTLPNVARPAGPGAIPANDWYADYQDHLVNTQAAPTNPFNGNWNMGFSCCDSSVQVVTAVAELILSSVALVLPDADRFATVGLRPATASGVESSPGSPQTHTVIARAEGPSPPGSPAGTPGPPVAGATVVFRILSGPNVGLTSTGVTGADGEVSWTYTDSAVPFPSFGIDTIQAFIGTLESNKVTMEWLPFNRPPVANDDNFIIGEDGILNGNVLANDTDPDAGDTITAALVTGPAHGTLVLNADGTFTYTPVANYCGPDSFTYDVSDGEADGNVATVSIDVTCVNDAPVAADSSVTTPEDTPVPGTVTSTDVDGPSATYAIVTGPAHGTLVLDPTTGAYTYTPALDYNGPDSFTFSVDDGAGGTDTGEVSITVTPVNDLPVCTAAGPSVASLWPPDHGLSSINVLGVVDPVEGSAITITVDSIWQDEPTDTIGDGNTPIDGYGVGTPVAQVRRERSGSKRVPGDGRMYYINFTGTDAEGGTCTGTVQVGVPHDMGQDHVIGAGGPIYSSTGQ